MKIIKINIEVYREKEDLDFGELSREAKKEIAYFIKSKIPNSEVRADYMGSQDERQ